MYMNVHCMYVCNGHSTAFYLTLIIEILFATAHIGSVTISKSVLLLFCHFGKSDLVNQLINLSIDPFNGCIICLNW